MLSPDLQDAIFVWRQVGVFTDVTAAMLGAFLGSFLGLMVALFAL